MTIDETMNNARDMLMYRKLEELEIYKKALYMACNGQKYLVKDFLRKAREE